MKPLPTTIPSRPQAQPPLRQGLPDFRTRNQHLQPFSWIRLSAASPQSA
ncbi:hypothetical protein [Chitiniphilus shinanonensis]|nr:hypothetical protein [Chitiniphilus shinanonensis]